MLLAGWHHGEQLKLSTALFALLALPCFGSFWLVSFLPANESSKQLISSRVKPREVDRQTDKLTDRQNASGRIVSICLAITAKTRAQKRATTTTTATTKGTNHSNISNHNNNNYSCVSNKSIWNLTATTWRIRNVDAFMLARVQFGGMGREFRFSCFFQTNGAVQWAENKQSWYWIWNDLLLKMQLGEICSTWCVWLLLIGGLNC